MSVGVSDDEERNSGLEDYVPILRDGPNERAVIDEFTGMRRFMNTENLDLKPLIEVIEESDLENLNEYRQAGTPVLVDVPEYLTQTPRDNKYTSDVESLLASAGSPVDFLNDHSGDIGVPVVSGSLERPYDYVQLERRYRRLSDDFDSAAVRVFVPTDAFGNSQEEALRSLEATLDSRDIVLLDYVQAGSLGPAESGRNNLKQAANIFASNSTYILDAFNVFEGQNYNFGPAIARETGIEGFGDFAVDRRFPDAGDIPMGQHDTRNIYHYDFEERETKKFQGDGYKGRHSAFDRLSSWSKWNADHCEFCEQADKTDSEGPNTWKQIRMGHYIESVIAAEA